MGIALQQLDACVGALWHGLAPRTLLVLVSGGGDSAEVERLRVSAVLLLGQLCMTAAVMFVPHLFTAGCCDGRGACAGAAHETAGHRRHCGLGRGAAAGL